ncbi:MAG: tRNA (N6-isopentenyl adenosine(37)-C2)-methylthiotransferase MiaB [Chitinophagales bacterium]|nr:tRNA (N6-isopentenyl adenosine(37)-C2)-methylthiotransferase MiaB [Chitinophagales bacterium]MCZ2394821.1 tRNA (N6-isopentenyl adenosine(37)-C2)-methylthiotransferase MiaB [Chitinophagales bacterium]
MSEVLIKRNTPIEEERQGEVLEIDIQPIQAPGAKSFYIESYGCQMNFNDSEIVAAILFDNGYRLTNDFSEADLIFLNTCAVRDKAEQTIRKRLSDFNKIKSIKPDILVGLLGCMAERLKKTLLEDEKVVDIIVGPDAYRTLPRLINEAETGQKAINVILSREETYADIQPVRLDKNGISAFISIMRGCDNMCSFCVVPFTRGRERSRNPLSILEEAKLLLDKNYKEVTLLGQNVDSYKWKDDATGEEVNFAQLLEKVALLNPMLRIRFSTSHPKDITDEVLYTMAKYNNICNYIHLPVQSGSSSVLNRMNRTYDREWYLDRVEAIKRILPDCGISSDMIAGFCGETDEEHNETLSLMDKVKFDMSYMFYYSERPGTLAARKYTDDVPLEVKKARLQEIINLQSQHSLENNQSDIGKEHIVLVEKRSKRNEAEYCGRNDQNKMIVFPMENYKPGDYVKVLVEQVTAATLIGKVIEKINQL